MTLTTNYPNNATVKFNVTSGSSKVKVWSSSTKGTLVTLPWSGNISDLPKKFYLEGVSQSGVARDITLQMTIITADNIANSKRSTVFKINELTICKPTGSSWETLPWGQVLLRGETLRVKADISPAVPTTDSASAKIKAKTSVTNTGGFNFSLDELANGGTTLRGTTQTVTLLPTNPEDGINEHSSADWISSPTSNHNDSNRFDADMIAEGYNQRGKARDTGDEVAEEGSVSRTFIQAAGVEFVTVVFAEGLVAEKKDDKSQIQNQADIFYYSGHGAHFSGALTIEAGGTFNPTDATGHWDKDLEVVIIAGCAVLDINDYSNNYNSILDARENDASPGEKWIAAFTDSATNQYTGPKYFLGYDYYAPLDSQTIEGVANPNTTADIIGTWIDKKFNHGRNNVEAWKDANDNIYGRNACAIDMAATPHEYWHFKSKTIFSIPPQKVYTWVMKPSTDW